jgi:hypothetical protein
VTPGDCWKGSTTRAGRSVLPRDQGRHSPGATTRGGQAHPLAHYLPTFAVTVAAGAVALAVAVLRLRAREI